MPSPAAHKYGEDATRARLLRMAARPHRRSSQRERQVLYGASLAASVAAWDAYVKGVVHDFFQATAVPLMPHVSAHHQLARSMAQRLLDRFNVPNSENVRNLLIATTGYDPWPDWQWSLRSMDSLAIRLRLNEILKARHSVAHGFALPSFTWTVSPRGEMRLTAQVLQWNEAFFANLVRQTDGAISLHVQVTYSVAAPW